MLAFRREQHLRCAVPTRYLSGTYDDTHTGPKTRGKVFNLKRYTTGSVIKRKGFWRLQLDEIAEDGDRRRITKMTTIACTASGSTGKNLARRELARWREQLEGKAEHEEEIRSRPGRTSKVRAYAQAYLDRHGSISAVTREGYQNAINNLGFVGDKLLSELTSADVEDWDCQQRADGLSAATIAKRHAFLAQVIKYAVAAGDLDRSPLGLVRAPRRAPKPVNSLDQAQAAEVMATLAKGGTDPVCVAGRIALFTGMRRAEVCALTWGNVDFSRSEIRVVRALTRVKGGFSISSPKDVSGTGALRTIPMPAQLADLLREVKEEQFSARTSAGKNWTDELYVLGNPITGTWKSPSKLTSSWAAMAKLAGWTGSQGERITFHDLRHTFATIAIANGIDVMSLAAILGHRDASMTLNIYSMALQEPKRRAMEQLNGFYAGDAGGSAS